MVRLCDFKEYGSENGVSIKECFQKAPYIGKDKIVSYLRNNGRPTMVSVEISKDLITGERIPGEFSLTLFDDGNFSWWSDLAYHVEKYNLRLPKEFEDYVLNKNR